MKVIKAEQGYSLVESLVALALLMAVLVPAAMLLIYVGGNNLAKDKIVSLNYARNQMELVLASESDSTGFKKVDDTWWIKTEVLNDRNLYTIRVKAFKNDTLNTPHIELETARLWYKE